MAGVNLSMPKTELISTVLSAVGVATGLIPADVAAVTTGSYVASRTMAKVGGDKKDGIKTSEFWINIAVQVASAVLPAVGVPVPTPIILAGISGLYSIGRGIFKLFSK